jgi:hypothetical protein
LDVAQAPITLCLNDVVLQHRTQYELSALLHRDDALQLQGRFNGSASHTCRGSVGSAVVRGDGFGESVTNLLFSDVLKLGSGDSRLRSRTIVSEVEYGV